MSLEGKIKVGMAALLGFVAGMLLIGAVANGQSTRLELRQGKPYEPWVSQDPPMQFFYVANNFVAAAAPIVETVNCDRSGKNVMKAKDGHCYVVHQSLLNADIYLDPLAKLTVHLGQQTVELNAMDVFKMFQMAVSPGGEQ